MKHEGQQIACNHSFPKIKCSGNKWFVFTEDLPQPILQGVSSISPTFTKEIGWGSQVSTARGCKWYNSVERSETDLCLCKCKIMQTNQWMGPNFQIQCFYSIKRGVILRIKSPRLRLGLFIAAKCVKSQNHPPFYTIKWWTLCAPDTLLW